MGEWLDWIGDCVGLVATCFLNLAHKMCEENRNARTHLLGGQKFADPNT